MFGSPNLLFADEPTTGLDSFQAERVMEALKELAEEGGHTVITSIHQPRSSIYALFDDLMVLSEGRVMYLGPASKARDYFIEAMASIGLPFGVSKDVVRNSNPAELIIDLVSIDMSSPEMERKSHERLALLADYFQKHQKKTRKDSHHSQSVVGNELVATSVAAGAVSRRKPAKTGASMIEQFRLLFIRSWRQVHRSKVANFARACANIGSGVVFGCIYYKLGKGQSSMNDRLGLMQVAAVNTAMSTVIKTLNAFPIERNIVQSERAAGSYSVAPYLVSKLAAEFPLAAIFPNLFGVCVYRMCNLNPAKNCFLNFAALLTLEAFTSSALGMLVGAFTPDEDSALAVGPSLMTVAIIFSGFYISPDNIPKAFRWLKTTSLIKWAFEGLAVNELKGQEFDSDGDGKYRGPVIKTGDQLLERVGFGDSTVRNSVVGLSRILASCYALTYFFLVRDLPKVQEMVDPEEI
jgi:ABC-type multidrug transport system permease subunit